MGNVTNIEWTDSSWNPLRGCSTLSLGCKNCYAQTVAGRFAGPGQPYEGLIRHTTSGPRWNGNIKLVPEHLADPLRWTRPRRIFVNSMSDLFHPNVPDDYIAAVFGVMMYARDHIFQVLTKRPARMCAFLRSVTWEECHAQANAIFARPEVPGGKAWEKAYKPGATFPLPNVWLGVSVEDQAAADERIPLLLDTPATVRFLSCEPLLGPVTLSSWLAGGEAARLHWVIAGGESGAHARPMHPRWARQLRDECGAAGVAYFFKQYGEYIGHPLEDVTYEHVACLDVTGARFSYSANLDRGSRYILRDDSTAPWEPIAAPPVGAVVLDRVGKKRAGRQLDGVTHDDMPGSWPVQR